MRVLSPASRSLISRRAAEIGLTGEQALATVDAREHLLLSANDFAAITELPLWKVYRLAAAGELPHHREGRRVFFSVADTLSYLDPEEPECIPAPSCEDPPWHRTLLLSRLERRLALCHGPDRFDS